MAIFFESPIQAETVKASDTARRAGVSGPITDKSGSIDADDSQNLDLS